MIQIAMPLITEQELGRIPFASILLRLLSIDKVNELYDRNSGLTGPSFARAVLNDLGVRYEIENVEMLDELPEDTFITVSNHPYGHIDGIILVDLFGRLRTDYKVMVNSLLGRIETLSGNFICVTPVGTERTTPAKDSLHGIKEALSHVRDGHPLGIFPAGAVSDFSVKDGCVRDREWQEPVIRLIRRFRVPIIPVTFRDGNSPFYYSLGLIDWRVRLLRLPSEVFNKKDKPVRLAIGKIISVKEQDDLEDISEFRSFLWKKVYELK